MVRSGQVGVWACLWSRRTATPLCWLLLALLPTVTVKLESIAGLPSLLLRAWKGNTCEPTQHVKK